MTLLTWMSEQWKKIVFLEKTPESGEVILNQRRVFTLPNKAGLMYAVVLILIFVTSINYNLNLGLALTYLLIGIFVINTFYSFRNLAYLHLSPLSSPAIFAGDFAQFHLQIKNPSKLDRFAIWIDFNNKKNILHSSTVQAIDIEANSQANVKVGVQSTERGYLAIPRVRLQTSFPLGILKAWSTWLPDLQVLVFPKPEENAPPLPFVGESIHEGLQKNGDEDYAGVKSYQQGDPLKHLSWKHIARVDLDAGGTLISKQFSGGSIGEIHLDFSSLSPQLDIEVRLSRMTSWILEAESKGLAYGFQLDQIRYEAALGESHQLACLTALALYPHGN